MTDQQLIHRIATGADTSLYAVVVERYSARVMSRMMAMVHREELAAELTQQTFVRAYDRLQYCRGDELGPWLMAIAYHLALGVLDKERRRQTQPVEEAHAIADHSDAAEREERLQRMERCIAQLPEADQRLIQMHYFDHRSTADIARLTGLSQSNVLVKLHRIRQRLKQMMQQ